MIVRISTALHQRLLARAAADPAREVCGLLLGRDGVVEAIVEAENVAADPATAFEIDPHVQIATLKAARGGGVPVIGCYHSHPSGDARPSARDLELAQPGSLWLIVAVSEIAAWRRELDRFEPVSLLRTE